MKRFIILLSIIFLGSNFNCINAAAPVATPEKAPVKQEQKVVTKPADNEVIKVNSLELVKFPNRYLDKNITMNCRFDKFSTLGLDYKPTHKSSEDFISFLIKRDDTLNDIPLSELKIFLDKKTAEKFINLKSGDDITVTGKVFSTALGDPWVEVTKLEKVEKK
ncbi:hypothetical protein IJI31_02800 [bacterium]|nr:hypothetical protein [bacterium]